MSFFIGNWGSHDSICALKSFDGHCPSKQCFCRSICCAMQFSDNNEISKKLTADRTDADTRTLLDVYEAERPKFMTRGLVCRKLWDEIAKKINSQRGRRFKGFHCENKWKVLLRSYRRAGRAKEKGNVNAEQFKRTHPLHERINSILTQEPSRDITVSIKERKPSRERRLQDVAQASKKAERGIGSCAESNSSPSVIHPKTVRTPNGEFAAYLATLIDGLSAEPLRDKTMQNILQYVFNFRKKNLSHTGFNLKICEPMTSFNSVFLKPGLG
ncbi:uncharacterized protein LOC111251679 isoform X2 [Varroa destructor]|uniref:Myb/SANT-like DNA-binding domain-containing protein n=1 Tax=Varroa destructor TaxID=109461 RepID=A0A7M7KB54_VARDE|nr:uncharacterized protein LOC111251679 isoform X2 [Varroa destructor]